ncbi:ABC transporter ATP-binding protein [Nocardioides ginsengisoli]|uniref:ABC transporter ATP-binding protein n=1 Tax=Nocardioides ginsengisoli TaxID=363868 RepID=A0ABW3W2X8_9ACTN
MLASSDLNPDLLMSGCTKRFLAPGRELVTAVDDLSLEVAAGTFVSIIGSNGAGKSTTLAMIAGNLLADEGQVLVRGQDVTTLPSWRRIGLVSRVRQNPQDNMVSNLTIEENFALAMAGRRGRFPLRRTSSAKVRAAAQELLEPLGMGLENRLGAVSGSLSGGQRQAIAVAMACLGSPALMLLDEHVAALDPNSAARVNAATERLVRERRITTLMVTHDMKHALDHADRLLMMHQGRIVVDVCGEQLTDLTPRDLQQRFAALSGGSLSDSTLLAESSPT